MIAQTDLAYYSGEDNLTLPYLSIGAVGVVGTSSHFTGKPLAELIAAVGAGDLPRALALHRQVEAVLTGVFATQGCLLVKSGLAAKGLLEPVVRLPLAPATAEQVATFQSLLDAAGL